jgi:hypothetical protein
VRALGFGLAAARVAHHLDMTDGLVDGHFEVAEIDRLCQKGIATSSDYLVGAAEQRRRHRLIWHLGSLEIDGGLEPGRLLEGIERPTNTL